MKNDTTMSRRRLLARATAVAARGTPRFDESTGATRRSQHYGSKWFPDFLNRKSFQVRFVVHF
jgi:hypothetical protein